MQLGERFSLLFKIILPLLVIIGLSVSPTAYLVANSLREAHSAQSEARPEAAAGALQRVLTHEPWRTWLWEPLGQAQLAAGQADGAVQAFLMADQAGKLSSDGRFLLGEAYLQQGDSRRAEAAWQALLRLDKTSPDLDRLRRVYEHIVQLQLARHDFTAAVETLRAWRSADAQNPRTAYLLGLHLSVAKPDEAVPLLVEASTKDSSYTAPVQEMRRGLSLASISADPSYGWLMIGRSLGSIDQWDLAGGAFQRAVTASPDYAEAWAFLGEAHYHLDGSGKTELDRADTLNPESPVVRALFALYWRRQGAPEKALPFLEAIALQEPQESTWQVEIGNTLVETGDLEAARQAFQKAVDLSPQNALYYQYLARFSVQYNVDIRGVGLPAARQAVMLSPDDPASLDAMGWVLAALGDNATAERFLQQALERDAAYASASLHLGQLYLQQDTGRAHPYLTRAANLAGKGPIADIARRLLKRYYGEGS